MTTKTNFDKSFSYGVFYPIVNIGWSGPNVVQFKNNIEITSIEGTYKDGKMSTQGCVCPESNKTKCVYEKLPTNKFYIDTDTNIDVKKESCTNKYSPGSGDTYSTSNCIYTCKGKAWSGEFSSQLSTVIDSSIQGQCVKTSVDPTSYFTNFSINNDLLGVQDNGWKLDFDISNPNKGSIFARFYANVFQNEITENSLIYLPNIVTNISKNIGATKTPLPLAVQNYVSNTSIIYMISNIFYHQIYQTGPFKADNRNDFLFNCNRLTNLSNYKDDLCNILDTIFYDQKSKLDMIKKTLLFPEAYQDPSNGDCYLTVYLSFDQIDEYGTFQDPDTFFRLILSNFFRDREGINNNTKLPLSDPEFESINNFLYPNESIFLSSTNNTLSILKKPVTDPNNNKLVPFFQYNQLDDRPYYEFFVAAPITVKVTKWSVMTLAYFESQLGGKMNYTNSMINKIIQETGTIPFSYYQSNRTKDNIETYCMSNYSFENIQPSNTTLSQFVVTSASPDCLCYNSFVAPAGSQKQGTAEALCFNKKCNDRPEVLTLLGINNNTCNDIEVCSTVQDWVYSKNDGTILPGKDSDFDKDKFEKNCGVVKPDTLSLFNTNVLVIGIFYTVIMTGLAFLITKNKNYESFTMFCICLIVFSGFGYLTYYLSRFLLGKYICEGKEKKCVSAGAFNERKVIHIPEEFCYHDETITDINCDCQTNSDCGENCKCNGGICLPKDREKPNPNITYTTHIRKFLIISALIMSIALPVAFVYASKDYHWHINKYLYITLVILLSIIPIIYEMLESFKKVEVKTYPNLC